MSRINVDAATITALQAAHVTDFVLIELGFDSGTQYLADLPFDVVVGGQTYIAAQGIGTIEPITETDQETKGLSFVLSGVPGSAIAAALTEHVQGRTVVMKYVIVDGATLRVDPSIWSGHLDVMSIDDGIPLAKISVTAEHMLIQWQQPKGTLSSHQDQLLRSPTDKFFEHAAKLSQATLVWPDKSFFQR